MRFRYLKLLIFLFCFFSFEAYGQDIVFVGLPVVKNTASHEKSENETLDNKGQLTYKLTILREGGQYYWNSRDNKPLEYKQNGPFHYFYEPLGGSYIKIMQAEKGKYLYMEHLSLGFNAVTYWGGGSKLNLPGKENQ